MPSADALDRLRHALVPVVVAVLVAGALAAWRHDAPSDAGIPSGSAAAPSASADGAPEDGGGEPGETGGAAGSDPVAPNDPGATVAGSAPGVGERDGPGALQVPTEGEFRYAVESVRDGTTTTRSETHRVRVLESGTEGATVEVSITDDGETQTSVFDWSAAGAFVRTTRIEADGEVSNDCVWSPPFAELGPLAPGARWSLESTCRTEVAGILTDFAVTGTGQVTGRAEIEGPDGPVTVWRIERDRTTTITATVGDDPLEQRAREEGVIFVDPKAGRIVRSEVTVTLSGTQEGQTRRVSTLTSDG